MGKRTKVLIQVILLILSYEASSSLKKAKVLLKKENYPDAAVNFYKEYQAKKSKKRKLIAEYGLGKSLLSLDLNYSAAKYLGETIKRGDKDNPYFMKAFQSFYQVHSLIEFSNSFISSVLQDVEVSPRLFPPKERDFYLFHKGRTLFEENKFKKSYQFFSLVSQESLASAKSAFYKGIIEAALDQKEKAIESFKEAVIRSKGSTSKELIREEVSLNIARIYYSEGDFSSAIRYYSKIPRDSLNWLQALFEAAWAFSLMEKPNNTLGNLHTILSPFYQDRFYPEADILKTITLFQLCYYEGVEKLLENFEQKYKPLQRSVAKLLKKSEKKEGYLAFYVKKNLGKRDNPMNEVLREMSEVKSYKTLKVSLMNLNRELREVEGIFSDKSQAKVKKDIETHLKETKSDLKMNREKELIGLLKERKSYLDNMFEQAILIHAETLLKNIAKIKKQLNIRSKEDNKIFIGGMQALTLGQSLEYWPFEGEYWEDELGGYVYNLPNICEK